ncbi:AAA family ATPase [Pseudomonas sp. WS 5146]|uniref:AAA family ATPase n=1 Tax=Pseudomonas sp. WS 5146 TaxID=2717494 RepID=UPI0014731A7B|nr:AAA family ATPase [Pseudomonas sp. WS 5146]NMX59072.1 AAA family ATPase [Pseudomonas sp. WS 5146]
MYIRSLHVKNLKRLKDLTLNFTQANGEPRMWTVLIGENGTGKTSILQAIALAAAGSLRVNDLAGSSITHLLDRRDKSTLEINADFKFTPTSINAKYHPDLKAMPFYGMGLKSSVILKPKETSLRASDKYDLDSAQDIVNPLDTARATEAPSWFVIGYGVQRTLPEAGGMPDLARASVDRMKSLFDSRASLTSTSFLSHFGDRQKKALAYSRILKSTIIDTGILPLDIENLEMRGQGGVKRASDLIERNRFHQKMGEKTFQVPAIALAHGYQSTIAWIADLVGHILLESPNSDLEPEEFEGLVLIDEIDLYLHPKWQCQLIPALRKTFPKLQFVVTTHSPVVLATLSPEEVVRVQADPATGDVHQITPDSVTGEWDEVEGEADLHTQPDPRAMTGTEMYTEYFGIDRLTLNINGEKIRQYTALASNPFRNDHQNAVMLALRAELETDNVLDLISPVARDHD